MFRGSKMAATGGGRLGARLRAVSMASLLALMAATPGGVLAGSPVAAPGGVDDGGGAHSFLPQGASRGGVVLGPTGNLGSSTDLSYHGGDVMRDVTNYLIFWDPGSTLSNGFKSFMEQYFTDVGSTPFMAINSQYGDTSGLPVPATNHFGGAWLDTNAYGHAGTFADPVTRADVQTEISNAIAANPAWQGPGLSTMYFVYLGQNIIECKGTNDCFAGPGVPNASAKYCAYHSYFNGDTIFATMPYVDSSTVCGSNSNYPNGEAVDLETSPTSHEQFEAYSDPHLNAWYNSSTGNENGDQCAYTYGTFEPDGTNLVLHGHEYQSQIEWNNGLPDGCVKRVLPASTPTISGNLAFGVVPRGTSVTKDVVLSNTGAADMNLMDVRFGSGADPALSITPAIPHVATIAAGDAVTYHVTFAPPASASSSSPFSTTLIVDTDEPGLETQSIGVSGSTGLPIDVATPASLDYGIVCPATFADLPLTVTNTGNASLTVNGVALAGGSDPSLTIVTSPSLPQTLAVGAHLSFTVRVTIAGGTAAGPVSGTVVVTTNDPVNPLVNVPVSATIGSGVLTLSATAKDFGGVAVDDRTSPSTADRTITISNSGTCDLAIASAGLAISGTNASDFSLVGAPTLPLTIAAGTSATIDVRFNPSGPGGRLATLTLTPAAPLAPATVDLTGTGLIPGILMTPAGLMFPPTVIASMAPGYPGTTLPDRIANNGQAELIVDAIGASAVPFSAPGPTSPLSRYAVGTGFNEPVTFAPTTSGKFLGTLDVADTGAGVGPVTGSIPLCGEGVGRGIRVLVVDGTGTPIGLVSKLKLQSHGTAQLVNVNLMNLALTVAANSCNAQQMQYENQALPTAANNGTKSSYYTLSVTAGGKSTTITFTLGVAEFKTLIVTVK